MPIFKIAVGMSLAAALFSVSAKDRDLTHRGIVNGAPDQIVSPSTEPRLSQGGAARTICKLEKTITAREARALVLTVATEEDFYPNFVGSIAKVESGFNVVALSNKGAFGLMQLLPETARRFGVDLCDPTSNVRGGIRYLRALHEKYRNPFFILAAYNAGELAVDRSRGVPPFPETVRFVADVINDFYVWPVPGEDASHTRRPQATVAPDLIEPRSPASTPQPAEPAARSRSGDGFVTHLD